MFTHAKHIVEDELRRLQFTHDVVNSKLVPTADFVKNLHDAQEIKKRERMTLRKLQFELLKRRQAVRDRKGFESEQEEQQSMSPEEWSKKKRKENKEDQELLNKNKPKQDEASFSYRRNLLLKPKTREEMSQLEQEIKHLYDLLHRYEQDEQALEQKINRLELSLRSISQEGLLPQMMTENDKVETKVTVDQYRGGHLVSSGPSTGSGIGGATSGGTGDAIAGGGSNSPGSTTTTTTTGSNNVLTKLLEESNMQDFVGGWRLKKLRLEYASCHERVVLLRTEMKVRNKDVVHQRKKMDQVALAKQANKHKKEKLRQKILAAKAERLAKGLKNMGVASNTGSVGSKKKKKLTVAELEDGSSMIRTFEQEKRREEDNAIPITANFGHEKEEQEDLEHDTNSTTGNKVRFIRSNGVYPHESMLMAPQRRAKGQISGALPVLQHGGVYRTGVVNMGVFLSRKVVHPPPMTRKRSLVAQRSMLQDEVDKKESGSNKDVDDGKDSVDTLHSAIVEGGGVIVPIITSSSPKSLKALVASNNNSNASALKKYEPYSDRKRIEQEEQQRKEQERKTTKKGNEDTSHSAGKDAKKTKPTKRTKTDWFTNMVEKEEWLMPSGMPSLPDGERTASSYSATSLPSSAASGLYSALSLPSAMNGINVLDPTTMGTRPTTISTTVTFSTSSRSPLVAMCEMLDVPRVVYLEYLLSKKISTVVQYLLQTKTPLMAIEQRKIQWIKPVLAEKADSAREALAFYRASLRTLQSLNPSDGDALFLAHISRDVAARRVVDALKLLSIDFGSSGSGSSNGGSNKGGPNHLKKKKHRNSGNGQPKPEKTTPLKMGWDTVLASLSDFDKTTVGPVVLKALKPLVRQLRLDIARRTENVNSDADIKPSLRAAKVIGAWLGSIVRWKDDYEGSLVQIEVLSKQKSLLEHAVTSVLGMSMKEGRG